jgi:integrase
MPKAKKLPSGMWRCQASVNGERRSFTAFTAKEAELMALEWQTGKKEKRNPGNITVDDMLTEYIEQRTNIVSPATIDGYRKIQRLYFADIKGKKISKLTEADVQNEVNKMAKTLSPKTIRNAYGLLRSATKIDFEITLPKKRKTPYRTPNIAGIRYILEQTVNTPIEVPVLLALWCGLRLSEIRGLKWSKVFPDHIVIDTAIVDVDGVPTEKSTKTTESDRVIEIPKYIYEKIMSQPQNTEYVTTLSGHAIYQRFQRLTGNICRFHDLRHANASVMMMLGIPDNVAMARGGWETESIYKKTYAQTLEESTKEANNIIDNYFTTLLPN